VETSPREIQEETKATEIQKKEWRISVGVHQSAMSHQKQRASLSKEAQL
jgi:hypothetical protein